MEPYKIFGGSEECHSNESGWTMYIGSLIKGADDSDDDAANAYAASADNGGPTHAHETDANHETDSDDSLASDASSGPIHQGKYYTGNVEGGGYGTSHFKHDQDEKEGDCYLDKKAKKSVKKKKLGIIKKERKEEKEQMTFMAKASSTPPRSGSEVRRSIWLGKRK